VSGLKLAIAAQAVESVQNIRENLLIKYRGVE
jgi:hypothetical protein